MIKWIHRKIDDYIDPKPTGFYNRITHPVDPSIIWPPIKREKFTGPLNKPPMIGKAIRIKKIIYPTQPEFVVITKPKQKVIPQPYSKKGVCQYTDGSFHQPDHILRQHVRNSAGFHNHFTN